MSDIRIASLESSGDLKAGLHATSKIPADSTKMKDTSEVSVLVDALNDKLLLSSHPFTMVDSASELSSCIDTITSLPKSPPALFVDLEGVNLSRHGSISLMQIHMSPLNETYLIDVHVLGSAAFSVMGTCGKSLKEVLEDAAIPKVFFDVRNDSDALYSHFGIHLEGVQDIQLMELATRRVSKRYVNGLAKCIERDLPMTEKERKEWADTKSKGVKLFLAEHGGSYEVFNQRPLAKNIADYCVQDVHLLPRLWKCYSSKLTPLWKIKVDKAVLDRVKLSQTATYKSQGPHKALGPWN